MKKIYVILTVLGLSLLAIIIIDFNKLKDESLLKQLESSDGTSIQIKYHPGNEALEPRVFVTYSFSKGGEIIDWFENYDSLNSSFIKNDTLTLYLSNQLEKIDTFRVVLN